jgi:hypothetical protein
VYLDRFPGQISHKFNLTDPEKASIFLWSVSARGTSVLHMNGNQASCVIRKSELAPKAVIETSKEP